jgi:putative ABC transport system permease protein
MTFWEDVRFGMRMLGKDPKFTAVVVLALGLGMGANTTVFTLVNAVLFRGLPFEKPEQMMFINSQKLAGSQGRMRVSYPDFRDFRAQSKSFQDMAAFEFETSNLSDHGTTPERYQGVRMTANTFGIIGQKPMLGRDFQPGEDKAGAPAVVILGYGIWATRYGKDPGILGRVVRVNDEPATVIGVMPEGIKFPVTQELWRPMTPTAEYEKRDLRRMNVFGRLKDGITITALQTEMTQIAKTLEKDNAATNQGISAYVRTYNDAFNGGQIRVVFLALLGAVGFVLLIACANVANLLLARSLARAKEVSIRAALGASRWRIVRQLLVESVMMALLGAGLGLLLSLWGVRTFSLAVASIDKPYWIKFTFDYVVFAYMAAIAVGTGILFGLAPALHMTKVDLNETLKESGRGTSGGSRSRFLAGSLVVGELALAVVLLAGAGLMIRNFLNLYAQDPGFRPENVLAAEFNMSEAKYAKPESRVHFAEQLLPRLQSVPGVEAVALVANIPLSGAPDWQFEVEGQAPVAKEKRPTASGQVITPAYFQAMGVNLSRGRAFNDADGLPGKLAVIVNQELAAKYWPKEDPLGKRLRLTRDKTDQPWLTVVGVGPNIRERMDQSETVGTLYVPYRQSPDLGMAIVARTKVPPATVAAAFRKEVQALDSDLPLFNVATVKEDINRAIWAFRVFGSLFGIFAGIALVLATVGIYAVMSYAVSQRTQEIGLRMALGASTGSIMRLVMSVGVKQLAIGLGIGIGAALLLTRAIKAILIGVSPSDPVTFATITVILASAGILACWMPARRATKVDPLIALRYE